jgi:hypothetical protein
VSHPYLHAAILLGLALASRQRRSNDEGDLKAMADIDHRIQKELERLDRMRKLADSKDGVRRRFRRDTSVQNYAAALAEAARLMRRAAEPGCVEEEATVAQAHVTSMTYAAFVSARSSSSTCRPIGRRRHGGTWKIPCWRHGHQLSEDCN